MDKSDMKLTTLIAKALLALIVAAMLMAVMILTDADVAGVIAK